MCRPNADFSRLFSVAGKLPKVVPDFLLKFRGLPPSFVRSRARTDLVERKTFLRLLILAKDALKQADRCCPVEVSRFDILVLELGDQALDIDPDRPRSQTFAAAR